MATTINPISGAIWEGADFTILARVVAPDGNALVTGNIEDYTVKIYETTTDPAAAVYSLESSDDSEIMFAALQTDGWWSADSAGYNLRYTAAMATINNTSEVIRGGHTYRTEIELTVAASYTGNASGVIPVIATVQVKARNAV